MLNQIGAQGLASLGVISAGNLASQPTMSSAGQLSQQYNSALAQQQMAWAQQQMYAWKQQQIAVVPPTWAFNGTIYNTAREMADAIWTHDCADKTHFLLKYE